MIKSLAIASAVSLGLGSFFLEIGTRADTTNDPFVAFGLLAAMAAGPIVLWKRRVAPLIPIIAIYCAIMPLLLLFMAFQIAWWHGRVDL